MCPCCSHWIQQCNQMSFLMISAHSLTQVPPRSYPSHRASPPPESPLRSPPANSPRRWGLLQVSNVINEVYGSGVMTSSGGGQSQSFPLQQKLVICTVLLMVKEGKSRDVMLGKVRFQFISFLNFLPLLPIPKLF